MEASLRQFKTTAQAADLTHQPGHIGLIHTKQQEPSPAKILLPIFAQSPESRDKKSPKFFSIPRDKFNFLTSAFVLLGLNRKSAFEIESFWD